MCEGPVPCLDTWFFMLLPIKTLAVGNIIVEEECELIDGSDTILPIKGW